MLLGKAKKPKTIKLKAADSTVPAELALMILIKSLKVYKRIMNLIKHMNINL